MPLNKRNTRSFTRRVYGGKLESVILYKRNDDQQQGTVTTYKLFRCRVGKITKSGETIQNEMTSNHRARWHIPLSELRRVGIAYLNPADRIKQIKSGRIWQPESTTLIEQKLFENEVDVDCLLRNQ